MSTEDKLLDFGDTENSNSNVFGEFSWQSSNNTDLLAEFDMSFNKSSEKSQGELELADQAEAGTTGSFLDEGNKEFDDPFATKLESSESLLKDFGFDSNLLSGGSSSNPFGEQSPFDSNFTTETSELGVTDSPTAETTELIADVEEEEAEEHGHADAEKKEAEESDEDGGPQVSSAIDDQVYYQDQDSSSEEEQNFDTIRPFKPTPAKRPSTSAVTSETHEEEDETASAGQQELLEDDEAEVEESEDEHAIVDQEDEKSGFREEEERVKEEVEEELQETEETARDSVNGTGDHEDSNVEAFLNARSRRFEDDDLETSDRQAEEHRDGSGFAYEGHVFQQEKLRDPSPELRESSRFVSDTTAAFDHQPEGGSDEMCRSCGKRVYQMERLIADKHVYHKMCFKCSKCRSILSVGNFAVNNNELYCKPHFMELFKYRGRYDDNPDAPANNGYTPPPPVRETRETRVAEEVNVGDVIRADEQVDDGISSGPSLSNLRSRFEVAESSEQPQREVPPTRQPRQWKYQQQRETEEELGDSRPSGSEIRREDELPPQNMARNIAAKFRELECSTDGAPVPGPSPRSERRYRDEIDEDREVVREADGNDVLPEVGTTRSLVSVWRNLESGDGRKEIAPSSQRHVSEMNQRQAERTERSPSLGSPSSEQNTGEDELPPRDTTRSMAAIFRALESQGGPPPTPDSAMKIQAKSREQSAANSNIRLPGRGQYPDESFEAERSNGHSHYSENEPVELDPDVVRNDEPASTEELPERGTTRNLVAMFKSMEAN